MRMIVFLPGTFDSKGIEFAFLKSLLEKQGIHCICADAGVLNSPSLTPDISREEVFSAAGTTLKNVFLEKDRGKAVEAAAKGLAKIALNLSRLTPFVPVLILKTRRKVLLSSIISSIS